MPRVNKKINRGYFNPTFLTALNSVIGAEFYNNLFDIYSNAKEFVALRETKGVSTGANMSTDKLNLSVERYTQTLTGMISSIANGDYDSGFGKKIGDLTGHFNDMVEQLQLLNNNLNPLADNARELKALVQGITKNYYSLQQVGTKRIFSASCKEDCRVSFLARVGQGMQSLFDQNWAIAIEECKNLVAVANAAMQAVAKCPEGVEDIPDAAFKKLKNSIFNFEHFM